MTTESSSLFSTRLKRIGCRARASIYIHMMQELAALRPSTKESFMGLMAKSINGVRQMFYGGSSSRTPRSIRLLVETDILKSFTSTMNRGNPVGSKKQEAEREIKEGGKDEL